MEVGYRGLKVYQKAYDGVLWVYEQTKALPASEMHGLTNQIRRAAVSVVANISEGYGKKEYSSAEYKRFLTISRASVNEVITLGCICSDVGYMPSTFKETIQQNYEEIGKMLFGIISKI